jgi:RNA polymerase sigma-70 factor (ECF subfamily)
VDEGLNSPERLRWERRIVQAASSGDRKALGELYEAYARLLFQRILLPRLGNAQAAEDALAETFRTAMERLHQFQPDKVSIYFWLARIAVNKATDMHRVKARTSRALASFEGLLAPLVEGGNPEPHDELLRQADLERVRGLVADVLDRINPRYRRAIELRFLMERSREECAAELEVKLGTFDVLLLRALRAFRKEWESATGPEQE